jgi:hypothetical protein
VPELHEEHEQNMNQSGLYAPVKAGSIEAVFAGRLMRKTVPFDDEEIRVISPL